MSVEHIPAQKAADLAAASSAGLAGVAWLADIEPYVTVLAGIVAIVAGCAATWYHIERAIQTHVRREREALEQELSRKIERDD